MYSLVIHSAECTLTSPCGSCEVLNFVRSKLSPEDLETYLRKLHLMEADSWSSENPAPLRASAWLLSHMTSKSASMISEHDAAMKIGHFLRRTGISIIGELTQKTERDVLRLSRNNPKTVDALKTVLAKVGRHFKEE